MIVGHHPHVVRELERYKQGLIAHSLGNFIFDQNFSEETMRGGMLYVTIKNNNYDVELREVIISETFRPYYE